MVGELLLEAFGLMVIGMVTVYAFLGLLILMTHWCSRLLQSSQPAVPPVAANDSIPAEHIAAITAAIHLHNASDDQG